MTIDLGVSVSTADEANSMVLHHLLLAATMFELTPDDGGASLHERLSTSCIEPSLRAIFSQFIVSMDSEMDTPEPTPIPSFITSAANRQMGEDKITDIGGKPHYKLVIGPNRDLPDEFIVNHYGEDGSCFGYMPGHPPLEG